MAVRVDTRGFVVAMLRCRWCLLAYSDDGDDGCTSQAMAMLSTYRLIIYDPPAAVERGPASILRALLDDYALTDYPGTFEVRASQPLFHVVPTSVRGRDGRSRPITSILDTRVTLTEGRRSVATLLDEVTADVSRQIGVRVSVGVVADNLLLQTFVQSAAVNESARQKIARALGTVNRPATWDLRYAPRVGAYMMGVVYLSR